MKYATSDSNVYLKGRGISPWDALFGRGLRPTSSNWSRNCTSEPQVSGRAATALTYVVVLLMEATEAYRQSGDVWRQSGSYLDRILYSLERRQLVDELQHGGAVL